MNGKGDILVVEDLRESLVMLTSMLRSQGYEARPAASGEEALKEVSDRVPELILLDVVMPGMNGFELLNRLKSIPECSSVPVIFISAVAGPDERVEGLKLGAVDFISKPFERAELLAKVRTHIERYQLRAALERRTRELSRERDLLAASELKYRTLIEASFDAILLVDRALAVQYANPAALGYLRRKAPEVIGRPLSSLFPPQVSQRQRQSLDEVFSRGKRQFMESRLESDGGVNYQETHLVPIGSPSGAVEAVLVILRDTTERRRLLEKFVQAQKMDSVGRLASGVVHDFNNILLVIHGYAEFLQGRLPRSDPGQKEVSGILSTVEHAAALTRQLSAFSRGQVLSRRVVDLNSVMKETDAMLRRLMGDQIRIVMRPSPVPCPVKVDPVQIEQVIMNMAVNARDAMPEGGTLTMEAGIVPAGRSECRPDAQEGRMACITISDTGLGMTEEVKSRIFEPFFTTKEKGKGAGLGLSIAYGIVTQIGGEIEVESSPGAGAVFRVCFPCEEGAVVSGDEEESPAQPSGGHETILVVDDNAQALDLTARYLREQGYEVLTAGGGREALEILKARGRPVDLLLTDVVMTEMNGQKLAAEAEKRKLAGRTLFMSGYTDARITRRSVLKPGLSLINKPFSHAALQRKIREVLDGPAGRPGA